MGSAARCFVSFVFGSLLGGGVAYYILRDHYDKTLAEEIDKFTVKYEEKHDVKKEEPAVETVIDIPDEPKKAVTEKFNPVMNEKDIVHYESYAKKYKKSSGKPAADMEKLTTKDMKDMYEEQLEEETFDDEEEDFDDEDIFPSEKRPEPYSVDPQGSEAINSTYDKTTLLWYSRDDILVVEETDEEFSDKDKRLGIGWRKYVGQYEPDMAYIRNDQLEEDYEIVRQNGRYYGE